MGYVARPELIAGPFLLVYSVVDRLSPQVHHFRKVSSTLNLVPNLLDTIGNFFCVFALFYIQPFFMARQLRVPVSIAPATATRPHSLARPTQRKNTPRPPRQRRLHPSRRPPHSIVPRAPDGAIAVSPCTIATAPKRVLRNRDRDFGIVSIAPSRSCR